MDIVVYIKGGENDELKYAIRTWCQNLTFNKLYVVGGPKPKWLEPDIYVENQPKFQKMRQALSNLIIAMSDDRLSEDVLILMDDVFVINYIGNWTINHNRGTLLEQKENSISRFGPNLYAEQLEYTSDAMSKIAQKPLSFEEHAPFVCNRKKMLEILELIKEENPDKLLCRSLYGNTYKCKTSKKLDIKIMDGGSKLPSNEKIVSTNPPAFRGACGQVIKDWFPDKSRYELY